MKEATIEVRPSRIPSHGPDLVNMETSSVCLSELDDFAERFAQIQKGPVDVRFAFAFHT